MQGEYWYAAQVSDTTMHNSSTNAGQQKTINHKLKTYLPPPGFLPPAPALGTRRFV
jgi:hypothetical protein